MYHFFYSLRRFEDGFIIDYQYTYGRPSFDYEFTDGGFYVFDYLGDGDCIVNFAMPIVGNGEIIDVIYKAIDNGTINSSGSLDTLIKEIRLGKRGDIAYNADALKKYKRYRGIHIRIPSREYNEAGGLPEISGTDSRGLASRGESGNSNESGNQELTTRHSLITPEMDASYLDAVVRGDMETALRMVMEARNVSARINMTPEERRNTSLSETEDVAREDQILLREGAEMSMAESKKKSTEETASPRKSDQPTAISSTDGAKILKKY